MARGWTLVPAAAVTWAVSGLVIVHPGAAPVVVGAAVAAVALATTLTRRERARARVRRAAAVVVLTALASMIAAAGSWAAIEPRERALEATRAPGPVDVVATVTGKLERWGGDQLAFDAVSVRVDSGAGEQRVSAPIQIIADPEDIVGAAELDVGARIQAVGSARPSDPGTRAVMRLHASGGLTVREPATGMLRVSSDLRRGLFDAVEGLPTAGASLVPGLAVGDTLLVDEALDAAMKESSLSHLTAVSGANCALVVGIAFGIAAAAGAGRVARILVAMIALAAFVVLVTPEPSVVRAAGMAAVAMLALLLGRPAQGIAVLAAAVCACLAVDPWLAGSLGFALSASATASLLLFARALARGLERLMPPVLALTVAVPLAAQLACGPLLILISPSVPVYGVAANVLAAPAAPAVTVLGLTACLAAPIPVLAAGLAAIAWLPAAWIAATAATVSALPGDQLPWIGGAGGALLLAALSAATGLALGLRGDDVRRRRVRAACRGLLAAVGGVLAGTVALAGLLGPLTVPPRWQILACDVGQGDAILLRSDERIVLVDTGPDPDALRGCLDRAGVDRLDLLVLTHFDHDHVGAWEVVRGRAAVVIHGPPDTAEDAEMLSSLSVAGAQIRQVQEGDSGAVGSARWQVLWPTESVGVPGNDASVVLAVTGGGLPATLLLGDLSEDPQRRLLPAIGSRFDVVKVAHHGSADQSATLYDRVAARVGLYTVGADNPFGHPRAEALSLVADGGGVIARTDRHGIVAVWREDDRLVVWRERGDVGAGG
ncbi:ComEC/Rec2 family competence protein [Microbacterium sp. KSW-48]|nr:ComEC/Rec2 family competence protein [Microbacterium sp. KSW-48]MDZ8172448.1 ComEC/Rec2 family competence protein [Microbacterium sp. KSW-48]